MMMGGEAYNMKIKWQHILYYDRGFSLVELLVVLCATCIIISIAVPSIRSLGSGIMVHTEAIQIAQDIRYTQQLSLNRGENYMLQLNKEQDFYYIKPVNRPNEKAVKQVRLNRDVHFHLCTFKPRGSHYYIQFNSNLGIPGQTGRVELIDNYGNMRKIIVEPTTGRVRIE